MNMSSTFHATGTAFAAEVVNVINDVKDGKRRQFAFVEFEGNTIFFHLGVAADYFSETGVAVVIKAGDRLDFEYEVIMDGNREQRRATKLLAHSEGDTYEGVVSVNPRGFGFINADPKHGLGKSVFIGNKSVEAVGLEGGERVRFTARENRKGLVALWIERVDGTGSSPTIQYTGNRDQMEFGRDNTRVGPPPLAKAKKEIKAEEERERRQRMRGANGSEGKVTSNPKKLRKRQRKLAQRK